MIGLLQARSDTQGAGWRPGMPANRHACGGAARCGTPHQVQQLVVLKQVGLLLLPDKLEQRGDRLLHLLRPDALGRHDSVQVLSAMCYEMR